MFKLTSKSQHKIKQVFQKQLFKDSFWMILFNIISSGIGFTYFVILARYLGAESYGIFVGVKSVWAIVFPFIGLGMSDILIQKVSRDASEFPRHLGNALISLIVSLILAIISIFPLVILVFPKISPLFILLILLGDLAGTRIYHIAKSCFIANHQIKAASQCSAVYMFGKLVSVICLPLFSESSYLVAWGFLYFIGSLTPGLFLMVVVCRKLGFPIYDLTNFPWLSLKEGFFFSLSASAVTINSEVDRSMLVALDSPIAAGIYGAGYRFIDIGFLPIMSVLSASYARFFKHGEKGLSGTIEFAKKLFPSAVMYGLLFGLCLIIFAPFTPKLLGEEYLEAKNVLFWLSPVILLGGIQFLAADSLTGAGFQRSRSFIQVAAAALNISLNFILIPIYSWKGAIAATLCSESFKTILLWLTVIILYIKEKRLRSMNN